MFIIYDLIFLLISIFYLPVYLFKKKLHAGLWQRLGILPKNTAFDSPVWIHAVSVGEAIAIRGLVEELRKAWQGKQIIFSTVTATGNRIVRDMAGKSDFVTYLPLDLSWIVRGMINRVRPSVFIIAETEIWPNLISQVFKYRIPVIIVNGRISDSSFRGYLRLRFLLKPVLNKVCAFCVQTERDAERLERLGVSGSKITVTGNMKFDAAGFKAGQRQEDKSLLGLRQEDKLWVAGSTHPGEEGIILAVHKELLKDIPKARLLIAPRHPERSREAAKIVSGFGLRCILVSELPAEHAAHAEAAVFILDSIGQLRQYYGIADAVFVGGSLVKKGGHNILEPASLGKPVVFGPHMFNFREIADLFLSNHSAIMVHTKEELKAIIADLLNDPAGARLLGERAKELVEKNQGATGRNARCITSLYK